MITDYADMNPYYPCRQTSAQSATICAIRDYLRAIIFIMNSLIAAATSMEIAPFLDEYRRRDKAELDILITGIGSTAATYSLVKQISIKKPGLIIQAGIAGCFDRNIPLGSVVVVKQDTVADQSVMENKQIMTMFDMGLVKPNQFPFKKGWLINPHKKFITKAKLKPVKAVTVNHISTDKKMIALYNRKFNATIESMEGAALHYVCLMEKIPFLQIRSISNYIGERDKKKWKMKAAIDNLNAVLIYLTSTLTSTSTLNP